MENYSDDVRTSLGAVDGARAAAADRLITPWWYHPVLGLLLGGFVVVNVLGNLAAYLVGFVVFFGGVALLTIAYKRLTGVWINGLRAGRATWWSIGMAVSVALVAAATIALHDEGDRPGPVWAAGAVIAALVVVFGIAFDRTVRRDLRAGTLTLPARR